jgi:phage terminase large subunit
MGISTAILEAGAKLRRYPVQWLKANFGTYLWTKQEEILQAVVEYRRVAVRAGNAVGKTYALAGLALWFLLAHYPSAVITTAPTWRQVRDVLWREIRKLWSQRRYISNLQPDLTQLIISPRQFAIGLATDQPERFQGFHERNILFIIDEASGVSDDIFGAIYRSLQGPNARLVVVGNPTRVDGEFYRAFTEKAAYWKQIHISAFDYLAWVKEHSPIPGLITERDVEEARQIWGEDSPMWAVGILGEFPKEIPGTLIPLYLVQQARYANLPIDESQPIEFGIDMADQFGDETAVCARRGDVVLFIKAWNEKSHEESMQEITRLIDLYKPEKVKLDYPGVGVGTYTVLERERIARKWDTLILKVRTGEKAMNHEAYRCVSDEMWFLLAERFRKGHIDLSRLDDLGYRKLVGQLISRQVGPGTPQYLESKVKLRSRGLPSPDRADALALAFYQPRKRYRNVTGEYIQGLYG